MAADAGITEAKYQMGQLYYLGYGVFERDFCAACKWLKAAEEGDREAQYNLGYAYQHGLGVERDMEKAIHWYEQSVQKGYQLSQVNLADLYAQLNRQQYEKALYW